MPLGILCPGQGSQHAAMFDLLQDVPEALDVLQTLEGVIGKNPMQLSPDEFQINVVAQPLVCGIQLATWSALRHRLAVPIAFAGYSVGELAAYGCAGSLRIRDVLQLARRRAELMDAAHMEKGGLLGVGGLARAKVEAIGSLEGCVIAIVNGEDRFIVGGPTMSLRCFEAAAIAAGAKTTRLNIGIASHTLMMTAARAPFVRALQQVDWRAPTAPVIAGISGAPIRRAPDAIATLGEQVAGPIDWAACLDTLVERGCTVLLEMGPGDGLARIAHGRHQNVHARSCSDFSTLSGAIEWANRLTG